MLLIAAACACCDHCEACGHWQCMHPAAAACQLLLKAVAVAAYCERVCLALSLQVIRDCSQHSHCKHTELRRCQLLKALLLGTCPCLQLYK